MRPFESRAGQGILPAVVVRMLHLLHFRYQIRRFHEFIRGIAPGDDWVIATESHRTRTAVYQVPLRARSMPILVSEPQPFGSMMINRGATHLGFTLESPSTAPEPALTIS